MSFHPASKYLVCGASSGIGLALVFSLLENHAPSQIYATYRDESDLKKLNELKGQHPDNLTLLRLNATSERDYIELSRNIAEVDTIINAIGLLHKTEGLNPERKIDDFELESHLEVYQTNTLPTMLLAKHLKSQIRNSNSPMFASISAKVGSITDNRIGGWHSYRISKAALNMVIKNLSIEFGRLNKRSLFLALHPGTTETKLSEPFMSGARKKYKIHSPKETAQNLLKVLSNLSSENNGGFYSWDGTELPW